MNGIRYLREHVFKCSQLELGGIAGVSQAAISRYERGLAEPRFDEMMRLRQAARERGFAWNDSWFFEPPSAPPPHVVAA